MQKKIEIFISDDMYNVPMSPGGNGDIFEFLNSLNEENAFKREQIICALRARFKIDITVTDMEAAKVNSYDEAAKVNSYDEAAKVNSYDKVPGDMASYVISGGKAYGR